MILDVEKFPGVRVERDALLGGYSTFRLGGPCRLLVHCENPDALAAAVGELHGKGLEFALLGGGSNVLIADRGVDGIVVRYAAPELRVKRDGNTLEAWACGGLDALSGYAAVQGLEGLTCCSGIPEN